MVRFRLVLLKSRALRAMPAALATRRSFRSLVIRAQKAPTNLRPVAILAFLALSALQWPARVRLPVCPALLVIFRI
jgi:hypothetical protein